jgi:hypothetical protein
MPAKQQASTRVTSKLDYDEDAASFFWGINIPKEDVPYNEISDIPDRLEVCLSYMRN